MSTTHHNYSFSTIYDTLLVQLPFEDRNFENITLSLKYRDQSFFPHFFFNLSNLSYLVLVKHQHELRWQELTAKLIASILNGIDSRRFIQCHWDSLTT